MRDDNIYISHFAPVILVSCLGISSYMPLWLTSHLIVPNEPCQFVQDQNLIIIHMYIIYHVIFHVILPCDVCYVSETSIKNEVGCKDDTVPKTVETRKQLRACNNLLQPPPYILDFGGCGRLLHALNPARSAF